MFCSKCGTKLEAEDVFCTICGEKTKAAENEKPPVSPSVETEAVKQAPVPVKPGKQSKIAIMIGAAALVVIIAVLAVLLVMKPRSTSLMVKEGNFKSPEAAVEHFMTAISDNDFETALEACAFNEAARNYDAAYNAERIRMLTLNMAAPSEYAFYQSLNQVFFLNQIASQVKYLTYSLSDSEKAVEMTQTGQNQLLYDPEGDAADFVEGVDPAALKGLKIERIDLPYPDLYDSEANRKNMNSTAKVYGADEVTDRVVLFELNGIKYFEGFALLRYGAN